MNLVLEDTLYSSDLTQTSSPSTLQCKFKTTAPNNNLLPPPGYNSGSAMSVGGHRGRAGSGTSPCSRLLDTEPPYSHLDDDSLRRLPVPITSIADDDDDEEDGGRTAPASKSDGGYDYAVDGSRSPEAAGVVVVDGRRHVGVVANAASQCSLPLPSNIDSESVAWGRFTSSGGRLELYDCGMPAD